MNMYRTMVHSMVRSIERICKRNGMVSAMCCVERSVITIQRLGKISAEMSLRKELQENSSKFGQAVSLWCRRHSSFVHLSASFRHSLCWKAASKDFARLFYFPCSFAKNFSILC